MAIGGGAHNGQYPTVSANPIRDPANNLVSMSLALGLTQVSGEIFADGLPTVNIWVLLISAVAGVHVTVQLQFAQGNVNLATVNYQNLGPAVPLILGVPSILTVRLGSARYRAVFDSTGTATLDYRLTGTLT